jgi:2-keto-4-pentenoate hydratase/2-oxohepta-3-ene-1,7-dioic acid hydratase in catechol pathway
MFQHKKLNGEKYNLSLGKIVCVGRNYAEHAKELGNEIPKSPLLFMKPATAAVDLESPFSIPSNQGAVHHEVEIVLLIGKEACAVSEDNAWDYVCAVGVALDLTLRDVQDKLKAKGQPWEMAKAFDGSAPLSSWVSLKDIKDRDNIQISLEKNSELKQSGSSDQMITSVPKLIAYISQFFTLMPGDVILTGTPAGVGPLESGDTFKAILAGSYEFSGKVL